MNLKQLRSQIPTWVWRGDRDGFGWNYVGTNGTETVKLVPYSVLSGPSDDDFATEWRVLKADGTSEPYSRWAFDPW